jgi:hypothetical protein
MKILFSSKSFVYSILVSYVCAWLPINKIAYHNSPINQEIALRSIMNSTSISQANEELLIKTIEQINLCR